MNCGIQSVKVLLFSLLLSSLTYSLSLSFSPSLTHFPDFLSRKSGQAYALIAYYFILFYLEGFL